MAAKTGTEDAYALRAEMTLAMKEHFGVFRDEPTMKAGLEKVMSVKERVKNIGLRWTGSVFNVDMIRTVEFEGMVDLALCVCLWARSSARSPAERTSAPTSTRATTRTGSTIHWPTTSLTRRAATG